MNKVILKGNLTRDPEVKTVSVSGKETKVANFTLAVSRRYTKKDGEKEQSTEYIDCEAWDTGAELIERLLSKGDPVLLDGSLKKESWEDKETGARRSRMKVRVSTFDKLARYSKQETTESPELVASNVGDEHGNGDGGDIPF